LKIRVADATPVIRKSASVRVPVRKLAMLVVSGVTARMAGMVGTGCRRQEWHEKQRKQYCHDTHAIHGDPLALMDAGRSALAVASLVGEGRLQFTFLEALRLTAHNKESSCVPGAMAREWAGTGAKYPVGTLITGL
jgi:hypothetical protein